MYRLIHISGEIWRKWAKDKSAAIMANNTMDAIKKKMQAMKLEKENAFDKADQLEQKLNEQKTVFEKVNIITINLI